MDGIDKKQCLHNCVNFDYQILATVRRDETPQNNTVREKRGVILYGEQQQLKGFFERRDCT